MGRLSDLGYGDEQELNLVYNPGGDFVPGSQHDLEEAFRKELSKKFGIRFNPEAARNFMCRTLISVDWKGFLYNCDFNQAIGASDHRRRSGDPEDRGSGDCGEKRQGTRAFRALLLLHRRGRI